MKLRGFIITYIDNLALYCRQLNQRFRYKEKGTGTFSLYSVICFNSMNAFAVFLICLKSSRVFITNACMENDHNKNESQFAK